MQINTFGEQLVENWSPYIQVQVSLPCIGTQFILRIFLFSQGLETWSACKHLRDVHVGGHENHADQLLAGDDLVFLQENLGEENDSDTASITSSFGESPPPSPPGSPPNLPRDPPNPPDSPPGRDNPSEILVVEAEQDEV